MVRTFAALGSLVALASVAASACFSYQDDPDRCYECRDEPDAGSGGAGGVITPSGCVPSENPGVGVEDSCGVFVAASGSDMGSGTKAEPVATLTKAIALAGSGERRIYLCAEQLEGAAKVPSGYTLFGGLDCAAEWVYIGGTTKTTLIGPADQIALVLQKGASTTRLEDVHVMARNATKAGGSSIAALAEGAAVELTRCTLEAGDAMAGAPGDAFTEVAAAGTDGNPGNEACSASIVVPGDQVLNTCGEESSIGGVGGLGLTNSGGPGDSGQPGSTANGGAGEMASACSDGLAGDPGMDGAPGPGGSGVGAIDSTGYTGVPGMSGAVGAPGQGGGGGGGSKGGFAVGKCTVMAMAGGASGGSGASGGCGGGGGKPGGAGGASIALISLGAKLTFADASLIAKSGGDGGPGGAGQDGGPGGMNGGLGGGVPGAALSLKAACAGGPGGNGGKGGPGGNGAGGHSLGIAYTGATPPLDGVMIQPGQAGSGGTPVDPAGEPGAAGSAAPSQAFQ
jgi:hypothetical protein